MHYLTLYLLLYSSVISADAEGNSSGGLSSTDRHERARSALSIPLSDGQTEASIQRLRQMLDDPEEVVRTAAATALLQLGEEAIFRERLVSAPLHRSRLEALIALRANLTGLEDPGLKEAARKLHREAELLLNPPLGEPDGESPVRNGRFDRGDIGDDWEIAAPLNAGSWARYDAEEGRTAPGSLLLYRPEAGEEVILRSRRKLKVPRGRMTPVRFYYRADSAPSGMMLQLLFEDEEGRRFNAPEELASITAESQTMVLNAPPGGWHKRVSEAPRASIDKEYTLLLVLRGNPGRVWIDDLAAPAPRYAYQWPAGTFSVRKETTLPKLSPTVEAKVVQEMGRPRLLIDDKRAVPILYLTQRTNMGDYAGAEKIGGVRMMVATVPLSDISDPRFEKRSPVWRDEREFDFSEVIKDIDRVAEEAPESSLILNLCVYWPMGWAEKNPNELWRDQAGRAGYGTQLRFIGFGETLPKGKNYRWWPSPSSTKAVEDAVFGIERLVSELKGRPYFGRIVGCHIAGGHDQQFFTGSWPDFSEPGVAAFRDWLRERYETVGALRKAWRDPEVGFETAGVPSYGALRQRGDSSFLDPLRDQAYVDHQEFQAEQGMLIRQKLARAFAKAMEKETVGMMWQIGGGRGQGTERLFLPGAKPEMLVTQPSYSVRLPGQVGGLRAMLSSMALHGKLSIKEMDLRTWLRPGGHEVNAMRLGAAWTPEMFRTIFRREAAQMMAAGHGFWLYDIVPVHYRDPEIYEEIGKVVKAYEELILDGAVIYRPDVAMAWTDTSSYWFSDSTHAVPMVNRLEFYTPPHLKESGVPYDTLFLKDLLKVHGERPYKVVVICDAWRLTNAERMELKQRLQNHGTVVIWNYAPGYLSDEGLSLDAMAELTGMTLVAKPTPQFIPSYFISDADLFTQGLSGVVGSGLMSMTVHEQRVRSSRLGNRFVRFEVTDPDAVALARYQSGGVAAAVRRFEGWTSIYLGMPGMLDARLLNRVARMAGAGVLTSPGVAVEFNGRFLSLHALMNGPVKVDLPQQSMVYDYDSGELIAQGGSTFEVAMMAGETRWFRVLADQQMDESITEQSKNQK